LLEEAKAVEPMMIIIIIINESLLNFRL
jgi:hypothetical protein